jgi:hypothetical protein
MKRSLMTIALACVLSSPALAGEIPSGGIAPPPPPSNGVITSATSPSDMLSVPGEVPTGGFAQEVSDTALSALLSVLGLVAA